MSKPAKQQTVTSAVSSAGSTAAPKATQSKTKVTRQSTKKSRIIAMLQSPSGASIAGMMKASGWLQHSVRGFLAGVVRRRLKLKLMSKVVGDKRVYHIVAGKAGKTKRVSATAATR